MGSVGVQRNAGCLPFFGSSRPPCRRREKEVDAMTVTNITSFDIFIVFLVGTIFGILLGKYVV
jgi:hypothetical protein